jgi:hypothetical protein
VAGNCECGNEPSGSIKLFNFLTMLSNIPLLHGVGKSVCIDREVHTFFPTSAVGLNIKDNPNSH